MSTETKHTKSFYKTEIPSDWEIVKVLDFGKVYTGNTPSTSEPDNYDGDFLFVSPGDLNEAKYIDNTEKTLTEKGFKISRKFPKGSVLFTCIGSTIGKSGIATVELTANQQINAVVVNVENSNEFLYYQLERNVNRIKLIAGEQAVPIINKSQFETIKILRAPLPEQKAIAQMLSTADAAIHTTEKLIAQKELRKKWLMQQLLTGKKRLNGFDSEWKFVRFKEIYSQVNQKAGDEKFLVLSVTKDGIVSQAEYFNKEIASEDTSPYLVVRKGDMAMSGLNFWMGSIDVLVEYEIGMVSPAYKVFKIHNPEISAAFMKSFVRSEIMLQCLIGSSVVGASIVRRNLDRETLDEWSFRLPSLEEQTAIAQVLEAADKEISLLKAKAEKLKEQKKGLMQVLLTGKKRLNLNLQD